MDIMEKLIENFKVLDDEEKAQVIDLVEYLKEKQNHSLIHNEETLTAIQEALDIQSGKIITKKYTSFQELLEELDDET